MMKKILMLLLMLTAVKASALTYFNDAEFTVGTGDDFTASIVIDFDEDNYFVFNYGWDDGQNPTGWDALTAINDYSSDFEMTYDTYDWGYMVSDFSYLGGVKYDYPHDSFNGWQYY